MTAPVAKDPTSEDPIREALANIPPMFFHISLDSVMGPGGCPITLVELLAAIRTSFPQGCEEDLQTALDWFDHHQAQG
jgi:hypothetical protein